MSFYKSIYKIAAIATAMFCTLNGAADDIYLRGSMNGWQVNNNWKFSTENNTLYHLDNVSISSEDEWKIGDADWKIIDFGGLEGVNPNEIAEMTYRGDNCTLATDYKGEVNFYLPTNEIIFGPAPEAWLKNDPLLLTSRTLPVLFINIYTDDTYTTLDPQVLSKDLSDKNYRPGLYWLDVSACPYAQEAGFENIGSQDEPLPLEMKGRGNWTFRGFAKKPFKLKLGSKQAMLNMGKKSKHWAILAHADDNRGYMRNYTGFDLGHRIGLPWTPDQQPVEVIINGDYRGLYFLTESIRVGDGRVPIEELEDNATDPALCSGGYLVELDNYDETNQTRLEEKGCNPAIMYHDALRVTWDTPEEYSDIQKRFITDEFTYINDAVGTCNKNNTLWSYVDLDDAARYYIVREMTSDVEAFHGSTYLFRDRGAEQKWHFSPIWDCGNAFNGPTNDFFFYNSPFGNTWIGSIYMNQKFVDKVKETWQWFTGNKLDGFWEGLESYANSLKAAAVSDRARWADVTPPDGGQDVVNNIDMDNRLSSVKEILKQKMQWLNQQWGDPVEGMAEPARDTTPAAPLPSYIEVGINTITFDDSNAPVEYFDLTGRRVAAPVQGSVTIEKRGTTVQKIIR